MKDQNYHDELEQFLSDAVEEHRMFPSDHIWSNIRHEVQGKKSWPALSIITFIIIISLAVTTFLNYPPDNIIAKIHYQDSVREEQREAQRIALATTRSSTNSFVQSISPASITAKTFSSLNEENEPNEPFEEPTLAGKNVTQQSLVVSNVPLKPASKPLFNITNAQNSINALSLGIIQKNMVDNAAENQPEAITPDANNSGKNETATTDFSDKGYRVASFGREKIKPNKWSFEFFATPSISYRKLVDSRNDKPVAASSVSIPNDSTLLKHKPALGIEVGAGVLYRLSKNLQLKAGLQFNVRQYYIDAFDSYDVANFAVVNRGSYLDSVNMFSRYSNINNYSSTKLDNRMYQISIPVGLQYKVIQSERWGVSVGASVQPTFTLNKNVYIISTDYKYYANGESFFRKFNINSSFDLNVSYRTSEFTKWYIGPQIRYQHLPTYNNAYPIKEYRWDYGIRMGVVKSF